VCVCVHCARPGVGAVVYWLPLSAPPRITHVLRAVAQRATPSLLLHIMVRSTHKGPSEGRSTTHGRAGCATHDTCVDTRVRPGCNEAD
jgi:hypothetical protein